MTLRDDLGAPVDLPTPPQRVVSLVPSLTEALAALVDYWFTQTDGQWLACCHNIGNPASGRVMEHVGFVFDHEGIDRKFDGTPVNCRYYLLTRTRWQALRQS